MHYWDNKRYTMICYCIMPNHVHMTINVGQRIKLSHEPPSSTVGKFNKLSYVLSHIMFSIKRHSAREANKVLGRTGAFWQHESYDHVVRDGRSLERIIGYVLQNPVKAHLVDEWGKWKWSYLRREP